jgi:hypothetical protein
MVKGCGGDFRVIWKLRTRRNRLFGCRDTNRVTNTNNPESNGVAGKLIELLLLAVGVVAGWIVWRWVRPYDD